MRWKGLKRKYGKAFIEFRKEYESGREDYEKYDDLMAWEFAELGRDYLTEGMGKWSINQGPKRRCCFSGNARMWPFCRNPSGG